MNFKEELPKVKAFVFDVDGVLARSMVLLHQSGDLMRTMNTKDGYAMQYAVKKGFPIAIITGGSSPSLKLRFNGLGITDIYLKSPDKWEDLKDFCAIYSLEPENIMYMGDDIPDYEVMTKVGVPVCPADAVPEIKSVAHYISNLIGGDGCVRDIIEQVLRAQGKWNLEVNDYKQ
jgi:3-deoxy-D-manno-octulosonate 8-phosphate phosphatase (KDO 8-P phosphatase)